MRLSRKFIIINAKLCWHIHTWIGWGNGGKPINGLHVPKFPLLQNWLASQIPYDSW